MRSGKSREAAVTVDVRDVESRGFDGADSLISIVTIATSGALGGFTAAIGESAWSGVRKIVERIRSSRSGPGKHRKIIVVVTSDGDTGGFRYRCEVDDEGDVEVLRRSIAELEAGRSAEELAGRRFEIVDGEWREV